MRQRKEMALDRGASWIKDRTVSRSKGGFEASNVRIKKS